MSLLKILFGLESKKSQESMARIRLTQDNIKIFPKFEALLHHGKIKIDSSGRLRYLHGAPVGDMVLFSINQDGKPFYKESVEEWFDTGSQKDNEFESAQEYRWL